VADKQREKVLMGDEAVALGAVHAGLSSAYGYPGTPSTEIMEYLLHNAPKHDYKASWCANEKTAYEEALGASFAGRRVLITMKHVGLNVAADPFINSALLGIHGGLVLAVADDPGMHSSQDEQDSRWLADFARVICLEPADAQEAYDMTREAFDLSERFQVPVVLRLVTRLAHARAVVRLGEQRAPNPLRKATDKKSWILLPSYARERWTKLLDRQVEFERYAHGSAHTALTLNPDNREVGYITTGTARGSFLENLPELSTKPSHLHIGAYPFSREAVTKLVKHVRRVVIIEEGYPYIERLLRGIIPPEVVIEGRMSGHIPREGELTPDNVRPAMGLAVRKKIEIQGFDIPGRPPQLCKGCPHIDSYESLNKVLQEFATPDTSMVHSDIGCYTLGALPPYNAIESCVCMGASIGLAKGAAEAGAHPSVAVIGDSTFYHSGITPLMDAISNRTRMTVLILDNEAVAMTGGQTTLMPPKTLEKVIAGLGLDESRIRIVEAHPRKREEFENVLREELNHEGVSVIIARRECLETARRKIKKG
jgi:indolepyruvate ferredoxin oxidoreductase alpha subunit